MIEIDMNQPSQQTEIRLVVNNGDLAALRDTVERLGFIDAAKLFRYTLAVLSQSATRALTITTLDGQRRTLTPNHSLLSEGNSTQDTESKGSE